MSVVAKLPGCRVCDKGMGLLAGGSDPKRTLPATGCLARSHAPRGSAARDARRHRSGRGASGEVLPRRAWERSLTCLLDLLPQCTSSRLRPPTRKVFNFNYSGRQIFPMQVSRCLLAMDHNNIWLDCIEQEPERLSQSLLRRKIIHSLCRRRVNVCFKHLDRTRLLQNPLDDATCIADGRATFFAGFQRAHLPFVQVRSKPSRLIETIAASPEVPKTR